MRETRNNESYLISTEIVMLFPQKFIWASFIGGYYVKRLQCGYRDAVISGIWTLHYTDSLLLDTSLEYK